jgi:hypothetical protein
LHLLRNCFGDKGVDDFFQFGKLVGVGENNATQFAAIDLPIAGFEVFAKGLQDGMPGGCAREVGVLRGQVGIDRVSAHVGKQVAHHALPRGDIAGNSDHESFLVHMEKYTRQ